MFSLRERWIASEIWLHAWLLASLILALRALVEATDFSLAALRSPTFLVLFLLAVPATFALTLVMSTVLGYCVFDGMVERQTRRNGGPFSIGDRVTIIAGRNAGRRATVTSYGQCRSLMLTIDDESDETAGYSHHQLKKTLPGDTGDGT